jgi:hypothetical protein
MTHNTNRILDDEGACIDDEGGPCPSASSRPARIRSPLPVVPCNSKDRLPWVRRSRFRQRRSRPGTLVSSSVPFYRQLDWGRSGNTSYGVHRASGIPADGYQIRGSHCIGWIKVPEDQKPGLWRI